MIVPICIILSLWLLIVSANMFHRTDDSETSSGDAVVSLFLLSTSLIFGSIGYLNHMSL